MQKRFVNSGLVMGYADYIYQVLHLAEVHDNDYEQLYFTKLFLNDQTRVINYFIFYLFCYFFKLNL